MKQVSQRGFTLVELSIVLVILGLLVGGVLSGQSLIHAAELRAVGTEYRQYQTALGAFRDKYIALPGDLPNAVSFWGAAAGGQARGYDAACAAVTTAATGTETCNGNGDGVIGYDGYIASSVDSSYETFRVWQHLANAGLVEGTYSGVEYVPNTQPAQAGVNVPVSRIRDGGWSLHHATMQGTNLLTRYNIPAGPNYKHFLFFSTFTAATDVCPLSSVDAFNIDKKLDDGHPRQGAIIATENRYCFPNPSYEACLATDGIWGDPNGNTYWTSEENQKGCRLMLMTGY